MLRTDLTSSSSAHAVALTYDRLMELKAAFLAQNPLESKERVEAFSKQILQQCGNNLEPLNTVVDPLNGRTLGHLALKKDERFAFAALLTAGIDTSKVDFSGQSIEDMMRKKLAADLNKLASSQASTSTPQQPSSELESSFFSHVAKGEISSVRMLLLQHPTLKNSFDGMGLNALHRAAFEGRFDLMRILIEEFDFDANGWTRQNVATVAHLVFYSGNSMPQDFLEYLTGKGVDMWAQSKTTLDLAKAPFSSPHRDLRNCVVIMTPDGKF